MPWEAGHACAGWQGGVISSGFAPHFQKGRQLHRKGRNQARAGLLQALGMTASSSGAAAGVGSDVAISQLWDTRDLQHWLKHRSGADLLPQIYCQQFLPSATPCTLQRLSCSSQCEMLPCSSPLWAGDAGGTEGPTGDTSTQDQCTGGWELRLGGPLTTSLLTWDCRKLEGSGKRGAWSDRGHSA